MRRRTVMSALVAGTGAVIFGQSDAARANESLTSDDRSTIQSIILAYFQRRANTITEAGRRMSATSWRESMTNALGRRLDDDVPSLFDGRNLAIAAHGGYSRSDTSIEVSRWATSADQVVVDVVEYTSLYFMGRRPGSVPASRYRLDHVLELTRVTPNRWALSNATVASDGALPPLTQPQLDRAGRRSVKSATSPHEKLGPPSSTNPVTTRTQAPRRLADVYNHDAMMTYAAFWATSRSPSFPNYHDDGGDCTNFVSQIMWAGGWAQIGPPGQSTRSKWFYGPTIKDCSFTWGAANNFHSFALTYSKRLTVVDDVFWCQDSDVVQYDWTADDSIDHTQFVSKNVYDEHSVELYMTQHDNDYYYRPLSEILADVLRTYPDVRAYGMSHTVW